ncbi:Crp/Fnr family transcriptional regulator [Novosphingobium sp. PC22D]|uniref:Crp/Fnr family transcriptional regulator n=1 Tax=Novosphingobium sp. PC22D TaxID=1962403 RepID=UPI001F0B31C2|nr:Crp/Fnr family transcriptional regulator [Novosphingobium sp. PC22D]
MIEGSNLLDALHPSDRAVLDPLLRECVFGAGNTLYEPGDLVDHCYFPRGSAIGSFFVLLDGGTVVETTMIGREGALGGIVSDGCMPAFARSNVMHKGSFYRIATADLNRAKTDSEGIRNLFARYADCLMAQVFQSIACNASHTIEQRAAKWLTGAVQRTGEMDVSMTQEQLASMMGIGRSYASRVIQRFKRDSLLRTRRGGIVVQDLEGLLDRACSCNDHVKRHFELVLGGVYPA